MARTIPLARWLAFAGALSLAAEGISAQSANYISGKRNWLATRYRGAIPPLNTHRNQRYGRTAEVDYMLGTSGCRVAGLRQRGANYLRHVFYSYPLASRSRQIVNAEWQRCSSTEPLGPLAADARSSLATTIVAGAGARGKIFDFGDRSIAAYPARRTRDLSRRELEARLVSVGQPAQILRALEPLAPTGARLRVIGRFAFVAAAGQSDDELNRMADLLERYVGFLAREYGLAVPDHYITIYLMPDISGVRQLAARAHGLDVSPSTLGYAFQDDLSTVGLVQGTEFGTITHELFHLLVRSSFGDIPQWLDEGMAGLYEVMEIRSEGFAGVPNWRGRVLRGQWNERPALAEVVTSPWFAFDFTDEPAMAEGPPLEHMAVHMATARYFALYLQEQGRLASLFRALQSRDPGAAADPGAATLALVEAQIGPIAQVQQAYDQWLDGVTREPPCVSAANAAPRAVPRTDKTEPPDPSRMVQQSNSVIQRPLSQSAVACP